MKKILISTLHVLFMMQQTSFAQVPFISSFSPASGAVGSIVTITGIGFSEVLEHNIVFFGATQATVTSASATSLSVAVPVGATYQYFSVTNLTVNLTAYSAQPFIVTFEAGGLAFEAKKDFATIGFPFSVSIGDIDGDGKPDLVVMNPFSNTVSSVLRNTSISGTVSFSPRVDFTTGVQPRSVSIGDIDGDGKPDLAVANLDGTVSILRNISTPGTINLSPKVDFVAGAGSLKVDIGDLDGDGKPDLAVANANDNSVSVLRNTSISGAVSFSTRVDFTTGTKPLSVVIGDIDGDGKPDLAVANEVGNTVSILRNISTVGTISLSPKVDLTTGTRPQALSIGDIDGDGKPDLATANFETNSISVLRNTSASGNISFSTKVDFSAGNSNTSNIGGIDIGDLDGDSKPDLAVACSGSNTVSVLRNTSTSGNISFDANVPLITGYSASSTRIGDIDGDGKSDLVACSFSSSGSVLIIKQLDPITGYTEQLTGLEVSTLYPNPIKNQMEVRLNGFDPNSPVIITVIDESGRKISESMEMEGNEIRLDVDHITSGYYFVQLVQGEKTQQFRFVKN